MPVDLAAIATRLKPGGEGVWYSGHRSEISHPEQCHHWYRLAEDDSYWFRHRAASIVACLRRIPPEGAVFDVGGGNGHVTKAMRDAGLESILVEPSVSAVSNAVSRGLSPIVCSTLEDAGFAAGSLPAVGLFDVLEHIADDAGFLRQIHSLVVPRGRLYLTVPAYPWLWSSHDELVGHYRRYTLGRLKRTLGSGHFEVEYGTYLFSFLVPPILLARTLPTRLGLRKPSGDQEQLCRELGGRASLANRLVAPLLRCEQALVRRGRFIPCGSSCLVVARAH
jgi:SAM-dependent methyltransferase